LLFAATPAMYKTALELEKQILSLITIQDESSVSDDDFNRIACDIFRFQHAHNKPYRAYCELLGIASTNVLNWKEIPAAPTSAFKRFSLSCFPINESQVEFHTSGTTKSESGKHFLRSTKLYHTALLQSFRSCFSQNSVQQRFYILTPPPEEAPLSSLVHMMGVLVKEFGSSESKYYVHDDKLLIDQLLHDLRSIEKLKKPVVLLGTAFAFVHLFDHCKQEETCLLLPDGSKVMETGGFKGRSREVSKLELYSMFEDHLGIPSKQVVNEYGMTELSSQFYDSSLIVGSQTDEKRIPHWTRIQIIDPRTSQESALGELGLIRVFDGANLWSVSSIQTDDFGIRTKQGFEIVGRASKAEPRGCSLNAEILRTL